METTVCAQHAADGVPAGAFGRRIFVVIEVEDSSDRAVGVYLCHHKQSLSENLPGNEAAVGIVRVCLVRMLGSNMVNFLNVRVFC